MTEFYPSKLLLFGEYTVLHGSQALAVPLQRWYGRWLHRPSTGLEVNSTLQSYQEWLLNNRIISDTISKKIQNDFEAGWTYRSDIPIGYGLGSSGALVAALYDRFIQEQYKVSSPEILGVLAKMEGYFHGSSSGMDPMVSLTGQAVYKDEKGIIKNVTDPGWPEGYRIYLIDSGMSRTTGPLVRQYRDRIMHPGFRQKIEHELIPMTEHAIHFYLSGTSVMLEECLHVISRFQRKHLDWLIPDAVQSQWDQLMNIPGVYVKFCGAGGGGYFLTIATTPGTIPGLERHIQIH